MWSDAAREAAIAARSKGGGPKINVGPKQGLFWHHPVSGNKNYGPVPAKHQHAVEAAGGPKATAKAKPTASPVKAGAPAGPKGHESAKPATKGSHGGGRPVAHGHGHGTNDPHKIYAHVGSAAEKATGGLGLIGKVVSTAMESTHQEGGGKKKE